MMHSKYVSKNPKETVVNIDLDNKDTFRINIDDPNGLEYIIVYPID